MSGANYRSELSLMTFSSLIRTAKRRLLPPSSRSFHDSTREIMDKLDMLSVQLSQVGGGLAHLTDQMELVKEQSRLRFEALYEREGESRDQSRRRFFSGIPDASGTLRLIQLANARLMYDLDKICREINVDYWFSYGSLVAALSRGGFIPWDDDIDICMMREDIERLRSALIQSDVYQVTLVYDWYSPCRQIRFSLRDSRIPCFIDVSIYDWAAGFSRRQDDELRALRLQLMDEVRQSYEFSYWKSRGWLFALNSGFVVQSGQVDYHTQDSIKAEETINRIERLFEKYNNKARLDGILCDKESATGLAYAIDNTYDAPWRRTLWPMDWIFPTTSCSFEGYSVMVPAKSKEVADECYPGWPYLPNDMLAQRHLSSIASTETDTIDAIRQYLKME